MGSDELKKRIAWQAALETSHPSYRVDCDGRLICWSEYGKCTEHGWEIDHIVPTVLGGLNFAENYRARHWRGNSLAGGILGALLKGTR